MPSILERMIEEERRRPWDVPRRDLFPEGLFSDDELPLAQGIVFG